MKAIQFFALRLVAIAAFSAALIGSPAMTQQPGTAPVARSDKARPDALEEVIVTGSLIPQQRAETANPVLVVTAEDIQKKGFITVADALQHMSLSTGFVQGPLTTGGFTQGAQTLSMFGLSPSYTKFLIDGRPLADYPALYNGTDIIASIDGIPTVLIDHVDILPGGQSSIYGSDAIAGVVNIALKKKTHETEVDLRYGWTKDGGGAEKRVGVVSGFSVGNFDMVVGGQYEKTDPIWGYQRPLTNQFFAGGSSAQTAERDWMILGLFGQPNGDVYYFQDPANCANVASQYGNSVALRTRAGRGRYCGTFKSGYYTINNGLEAEQGYLHASDDLNEHVQLFADVLLNHDINTFNTGTVSLQTSGESTSGVLSAERRMLVRLRNEGAISDETLRELEQELDHEAVRFGAGDVR